MSDEAILGCLHRDKPEEYQRIAKSVFGVARERSSSSCRERDIESVTLETAQRQVASGGELPKCVLGE